MKDWAQRNFGAIISPLITAMVLAALGLWFQSAVTKQLAGYITERQFIERNLVIDDRIMRLEKIVLEGRVDRLVFQREVLDRLIRGEERAIRIEERLAGHIQISHGASGKASP